MTNEPHFAFGLIVAAAVAGGDLGFRDDRDRPCGVQVLDARVRSGPRLAVRRLGRSFLR